MDRAVHLVSPTPLQLGSWLARPVPTGGAKFGRGDIDLEARFRALLKAGPSPGARLRLRRIYHAVGVPNRRRRSSTGRANLPPQRTRGGAP